MAEVLLINPPFLKLEGYRYKVGELGTKSAPPLGLAYLAAVLEESNVSVRIIDALAQELSLRDIEQQVELHIPLVIGITATTPMILHALETIRAAKRACPSTATVLGGPHATVRAAETMRDCPELDYSVIGEGEYTFLDLVRCLEQRGNSDSVAGIAYRLGDDIKLTEPRPLIEDLDEIPRPARHLLPMKLYSPSPINYRKKPATSVICSRGCPMQCIFCTKTIFGTRLRLRSPQNIYLEVKGLKEEYGIKEIHFYDDTFTMNARWVKETCSLLKGLNITWWCNGRVSNISEETLAQMKEAGCYRIYYGVESGNDKSLELLRKQITTEMIRKVFRITRKQGIEAAAFMMLGIPGEDAEDMQRSIDFAREIGAAHAVFTSLTPYPATYIYDNVEKFGRLTNTSWDKYVMISDQPAFLPYSATEAEIKKALSKAYWSFVMRPRYIMNKLKDIYYSPGKILPYFKGFLSLVRR